MMFPGIADAAEEAAAAAASLSRSRQALQDAAQQLFWDASEVDEAGLACKLAAASAHSDKLAADLATASAALSAEKQAHSSSTAASAKTIAQLRRSLTTKADSMHLLEGNFQACRSELALTTKELARTQDEVSDLTDEVAELTDVIDENNEFTNNLREEHEELQFRSTDNMDREGPACVQVAKLRETLAEEREEMIRSRARVAELECKLAGAAASRDLWSSLEGGAQGGTEAAACKLAGVAVLRGLVEGRVAELECKLGEERGVSEGLRMRLAAAEQALEAEEEEHGNTQGMAKLKWKVALVTRERYEEEFNDYNKEQRDKWNAWRLEFDAYKGAHNGSHTSASAPPPLPVTRTLPAHLANPPPLPHQRPHPQPPTQSATPAAASQSRPSTQPCPPTRDGQKSERKVKPARLSPEDAKSLFGTPPPRVPAPTSNPLPSFDPDGDEPPPLIRQEAPPPPPSQTHHQQQQQQQQQQQHVQQQPKPNPTPPPQAQRESVKAQPKPTPHTDSTPPPSPFAFPHHLTPSDVPSAAASPSLWNPPPRSEDMTAFANSHPPALDATTGVKALKLYLTQSGVKESTMRTLTYKSELLALALTRANAWEVRRIQACSAIVVADEDDYVTCEAEAYAAVFRVPESFFLGEGGDGKGKVYAQAVRDAFNRLRLMVHPDNNSPEDLEEAKRACSFLGFAYMHVPA